MDIFIVDICGSLVDDHIHIEYIVVITYKRSTNYTFIVGDVTLVSGDTDWNFKPVTHADRF